MRHVVKGRKLKRTASHRKALLANLATSLFEHKKIVTTEAKAKELRPYAEHLITKAKTALVRERQGLLPEGQTIDIHSRRIVARVIRRKSVLQELFDAIAPVVESRNGGYTRVVKLGFRRGDAGKTAMIELVDFAAPQDGVTSFKSKKRKKQTKPANKAAVATKADVAENAIAEEVVDTPQDEVANEVAPIVDTEVTDEAATIDAPAIAEDTQPIATTEITPDETAAEETKKITFDDTVEGDQEENKA